MPSPSMFEFARALTRRRGAALLVPILLICAVTLFSSWRSVGAQGAPADSASQTQSKRTAAEFVPGEILVRFRADAPAASKDARAPLTIRAAGRAIEVEIENFGGSEIVEGLRLARVAPDETATTLAALRERADVLYAEPNYIRRKTVAPNDARYAEQWGLKNTGQSVAGVPGGATGADVRAEQAWEITTGSRSVVVGIVDEGVDISHPDLAPNIWTNPSNDADRGFPGDLHGWDFVHNDNTVYDGTGSYPADATDAHGTHVAGIVGAAGGNGAGVAGVNWQVSLLPIKVLGPDGGTDADIIRGYAYAKMLRDLWDATNGARGANLRVLNNSYGGGGFSQSSLDAIRALNDSGILFVAAAGNASSDNDHIAQYPADYDAPNVVTVAATEQHDGLAYYSNFGAQKVALAAPGSYILSTTPGNTYSFFSGTSMAAPHVAGAAALLCAVRPGINVAQMRAALVFNGDAVAPLAGKAYSNRRLNVFAALQSVAENDTTPPAQASGLSVEGTGRTKTLHWIAPGDDGASGRAALYEFDFVDGTSGATYQLATQVPAPAGAQESVALNTPYRHTSGTLVIKTFDNAGNVSASSVGVTVNANAAEPYGVTEGDAGAASTNGTAINLHADDEYREEMLPFGFSLFGTIYNTVYVSTNGALYFTSPLNPDGSVQPDIPSSVVALNGRAMIAGLWDDLRTDRRAGDDVYIYEPNADTVIFRWQAVTYDSVLPDGSHRGENPVNFEIEIRRDGTIQMRYGAGNANVNPVVGISGGEPDAYVVASHTAEFGQPMTNLNNATSVTFKPNTFAITGHVANADGNTQIKLTGTRNFTNNLDSNGNYAFFNLPAGGDYTVAPVTTSNIFRYVYTPPSQTFNNLSANQVADFTAQRVEFSIHGRVTDASGAGLAGITVVLNPLIVTKTALTDAQGYYSFDNLAAGQSYTVGPASPDYTFTPFNQTVQNLNGNVTLPDFVGKRLYNISGRVVDATGRGLSGAFISSGAPEFRSATTDTNGNYTLFQLSAGVAYTVNASLAGYLIQPPSQTVASLDSNRTLPDFVARRLYVIQGNVHDSAGNGISGVSVSLAGAATNTVETAANGGYYLGTFAEGETYTVTLSKPYYTFDTPSITYTNLSAHQTANVVGTLAPNTILGRVTTPDGQGLGAAIPVVLSGARSASTHLDSAGYYVFGDLTVGASYTITPLSDAYTFTPASLTFDNFNDGVRSANFRATPTNNMRIDGSIDDGHGHALAGVRVNLTGAVNQFGVPYFASAVSDASGQFSFTNLTGGARYTLTPVGDAYNGFNPLSADISLFSNATVHFTATGLIAQPSAIQFNATNLRFSESIGSVTIFVSRAGDRSAPASVDYMTVDDQSAVRCDDTTTKQGVAFARCDYATTVGTLTFAPGEYLKSFSVPIIDDSFVEPDETVQLKLSNPSGAPLGTQNTMTVTILDDDVPGRPNPITQTPFFVRMQYLDFLAREPEAGEPWSALLQSCPDPFNTDPSSSSARCDRVTVSANFFLSDEFRLKGAFVFRFYKASFGRLPHYTEMVADMTSVTGATSQDVFAKKAAFTNSWVQRQEFKNLYDAMTDTQFVNTLMDRYQLPAITTVDPAHPDGSTKVTLTRADLTNQLTQQSLTRAQVVRAVADSNEVGASEFNPAFVAMQYFGYLRRDPDAQGYNDWLTYLGAHPGDFRTMVVGFVNAPEYKLRFGQP